MSFFIIIVLAAIFFVGYLIWKWGRAVGFSAGVEAENLFNVMGVNATLELMKKVSSEAQEVQAAK